MFFSIMKWATGKVGKPIIMRWLRSPRKTNFHGLTLVVMPGVFHPGLYFSSRYLAEYLSTLYLNGKKVFEPGCGSGAVSLFCASRGAIVTATDISSTAIANAQSNSALNLSALPFPPKFLVGDVFNGVSGDQYDYIVVNPPYFFAKPTSESEMAWYCGAEGAYFHAFFGALDSYIHAKTQVFMVLAENCDLKRIRGIAESYGFVMAEQAKRRIWWEENYIFNIRKGEVT